MGRDPADIERTVFLQDPAELEWLDGYAAGAQHIILGSAAPFDLRPLRALLAAADHAKHEGSR